jgi:radical SAM/Cys-rich protein
MSAFARIVENADSSALFAKRIDTLMLNVGLRCDQTCTHCHQSSSPLRGEVMSRDIMESAAAVADEVRPQLVDITGGAPELNPDIRYLLTLLRDASHPVRLRTNLTALLAPEAAGLIDLLADREVSVLASLSGTTRREITPQRGDVFDRSLAALRLLGEVGYGRNPRLRLDIAVNPTDDTLPEPQCVVQERFRTRLTDGLGIPFNDALMITNMPVGRFRDRLDRSGRLDAYARELRDSFNPETLAHLACRTCLEIAWDGTLWDCDFNLGCGVGLAEGLPTHVSQFDAALLARRPVRFAEHCFACTAMAGSG